MINTLFVLNIIVVLLMIGLILIQKSEGGVLGMGGGSKNALFTAGAAGNIVTRLTYILGGLFITICLVLAWLVARESGSEKSFVENMETTRSAVRAVKTVPAEKVPEDSVKKQMEQDGNKPFAPMN
ncbi:MAG: preprotein translocase subunit SecG [Rickettsiales bacterium]|jgi:protein translocase SecG subunit|nr:preprotein translocase subunit SecG [Rickettsiales bacterium]